MHDGAVVFDTRLNNKQLEKDYAKAVKKVEEMEAELSDKKEKQNAVSAQLEDVSEKADAARNHVKMLKDELSAINEAMKPGSSPEDFIEARERKPIVEAGLKEAEKELVPLQKEADKLKVKLEACRDEVNTAGVKFERAVDAAARLSNKIDEENAALQKQEKEAEDVTEEIVETSVAEKTLEKNTDNTAKRFDALGKRFASLAASALVFSVATKGLTMMRDWLGEVVTKNDQTAAAIARLKGALLTLAQPLLNVVIPVFTALVNLLTAVIGRIATFLSMLGGKSADESAKAAKALHNQGKAYEEVGDAAKEASKQLMGFDELNRLEDTSVSAGGSGGGNSGEIAPDFSWSEGVTETMEKLAGWVLVIAAGLAMWKIGSALPGTLGAVMTVIGKILAGVGLVAAGFILLASGFQDAAENGMNLENMLTMIAGIIATGLGITLLTGSLIPLLVAAIMGLLVALAYLTGNGGAMIEGFKDLFGGLLDFITGVFAGDWEKAWRGLMQAMNGFVNIGVSIINSFIDLIVMGLNAIQIDIPEWVPLIGGRHFGFNLVAPQIPYLAQGAVIPPNREFMAVLGDQKHGTNIEAPEDLIRKIVREETAGLGGSDRLVQLMEILIDTVENIEVGDETIGKAAARYSRSTARARGT